MSVQPHALMNNFESAVVVEFELIGPINCADGLEVCSRTTAVSWCQNLLLTFK